jgi:tripartite-type tricarboxylate transporter receptor subunit TctC
VAALVLATAACDRGSGEAVAGAEEAGCGFFRGKATTLVVDRSPGGGYDQYARLVAPYIAEQLGARYMIVENRPGAGGLLAMNRMVSSVKPDGLTIAIFNAPGLLPAIISGVEGARFGPSDLTWLGRLGTEPDVVVVAADSPIRRFDDLLHPGEPISWGSSGPGAADYVNPAILTEVFDLPAKIIAGFDGASEIELALMRGDIDAMTGTLDSRLPSLLGGNTRALAVLDAEGVPALPGVPTVFDYEVSAPMRAILEAHVAIKQIGRPLVAPPNVPADRVECLRRAVERAVTTPELIAKAEQMRRPIKFLSGEEQQQLAVDLVNAPAGYVGVLREVYAR